MRIWRERSLFIKLFIIEMSMLGLIIASTSIVLYHYSKTVFIRSAESKAIDVTANINEGLEQNVEQMDRIISSFYSDPAIEPFLTTEDFTDTVEQYQFLKTMDRFFQQLVNLRPDFTSVYVYVSEAKSYSYSVIGTTKLDYSPANETWFEDTLQAGGKTHISAPHEPFQLVKGKPVLSFSRALIHYEGPDPVVLIDVSASMLEEVLKGSKLLPGSAVQLIDRGGQSVYEYGNYREGTEYYSFEGTSELTGWKVITRIPKTEFAKESNKLMSFTLGLAAGALALAALMAYLFSTYTIIPIKSLQRGMSVVKRGDLSVRLKPRSMDELGQLTLQFNSMIEQLQRLIRETYEEKLARQTAEFKYLQAQINPHFLYNALQVISSMASVYKTPTIGKASKALSKVLRYSMNGKAQVVTLQQELDNLQNYMDIQQMRFGEFIAYDLQIEENVRTCAIVKLVLQPIVENAIVHGIERRGKPGTIRVTAYSDGGIVRVITEDDGIGMTEEQLTKLREHLDSEQEPSLSGAESNNRVGLRNIHQRLKIAFGAEAGLEVASTQGVGTSVTVKLPNQKASI